MQRGDFLKALALMGVGIGTTKDALANNILQAPPNFRLGLASYTLRKFSLDEVIAICNRLEIKDLALKSMHLPLEDTDAQIKEKAAKVRAAGINLYGAGVIYMKNETEVNQAFRYAQVADLKMIIGVPNHDLLPIVEAKVKETNIVLAIHNHGPGDLVYPTPATVYEKIARLDKRIGLCIDIGHVQRLGMDPIASILKYGDRMCDMHMKDVDGNKAENKPIQIGRGVIDISGVLKALKKIKYNGVIGLEYEKDADHAESGLAESIGYLRGLSN